MKQMSSLGASYADALFEISTENKSLDGMLADIQLLSKVLGDNEEFVKFLNAPVISKDEKIDMTDKVLSQAVNKDLCSCLKVMIQRKETECLADCLKEFEKRYNAYNNIEKAVAITAVPMSEDMQKALGAKLEKVTGKKILLENRVDSSCIGGVILEMADTQYNDSIYAKLENLKNQLKQI